MKILPTPPAPVLRASMTLCPFWESPGSEPLTTTLQVIVVTEQLDGDQPTAQETDLPELKEGGWIGRKHGILTVYTRTIG